MSHVNKPNPSTADSETTSPPVLPRSTVEARVRSFTPSAISRITAPKRAAVAVLLRYERDEPDVLLIKRAARDGDQWSGHVSFPGGMQDEGDADLVTTAARETREEVGIDRESTARFVGPLSDQRAIARARTLPMAISPFVFIQTQPSPIAIGEEADEAFWLPLDRVLSGELDSTFDYKLGPLEIPLKCWRYDGKVVWGLTYRMLTGLLAVIA